MYCCLLGCGYFCLLLSFACGYCNQRNHQVNVNGIFWATVNVLFLALYHWHVGVLQVNGKVHA